MMKKDCFTSDTIPGFEFSNEDGVFVAAKAYLLSENTIKVMSSVK